MVSFGGRQDNPAGFDTVPLTFLRRCVRGLPIDQQPTGLLNDPSATPCAHQGIEKGTAPQDVELSSAWGAVFYPRLTQIVRETLIGVTVRIFGLCESANGADDQRVSTLVLGEMGDDDFVALVVHGLPLVLTE